MASIVRHTLLVLAGILVFAVVGSAQTRQLDSGERWRAITDGTFAYGAYCAGCHGQDGSGNSPLAKRNPTKVPDLRRLANQPGGFDKSMVLEHIYATNQWTRDPMPAWGNVFRTTAGRSDGYALLAAHNVMRYVESMQQETRLAVKK